MRGRKTGPETMLRRRNAIHRFAIVLLTVIATVSVSRSQTACDGPLNAGNPTEYLVEMAVAVDPTDNDRQAIAVTQPAAGNSQNPAPGDTKIRAWITFDGGRTWTESEVPTPGGSEYVGTIPYSDPTVVYDELGNLYVGYLLNRRDDNIQRQIIVAKATAGTTTFTAYAASPWYDGTRKLDKPWLAVDESPASGTQGQLYVAYSTNDDNQIYLTKSTPGERGTAWSSPVKITVPGKNGFFVDLATGVDGTVYAAWFCFCGGSVSEIIFSDLGPGATSPGSVVTLKQVNNDLPISTTASPSRGVYPVPSIAVDRSNGAHQGRVWVAYSDFGTDPDRMDVYVQYWDGGLAPWSPPINLGRPDSSQFLPWITVDPLDGSVGLVYYSTAGDPSDASTNTIYRSFVDGTPTDPDHWPERTLSERRSSPAASTDGNEYREYIGLVERRNVAYASWTALDSGEGQMIYAQVHGPLSQIHSSATDEPSDRFGEAMTTGDFDGDGYDDIAIGAPYENDVAADDGFVAIYYGSPDALTPPRWERIGQAGAGQASEVGDQFGSALAAGDFDQDGYDDLAVGIPGEDDVSADDGALLVYHGSAQGLVPVNAIYFDQTDFGLDSGLDDRFASVLTSGDFDGDSYVDLAIGVPGEDDVAIQDGNVIVQYGGPLGLGTTDWERLRQSQGGMGGEDGDRFGDALAAGDFNGDGRDDLAVGLPDEDDAAADDGNVLVFLGSSNGLLPAATERLSQPDAGRPSEPGDRFGASLAAGDFNGDGLDDLGVGVPDEFQNQPGDGALIVYYGAAGGLLPASTELLLQTTGGETMEPGDRFGAALTSGNFDGDGFADLVVGIPTEDALATDEGAVVVFYGSGAGLVPARSDVIRSGDAGGAPEASDEFGAVLTTGDFNADCIDDLVIAAYSEDFGGAGDAGMVFPLAGRPDGLLAGPQRRIPGDANCDGCVDHHDRQAVISASGGPDQCGTDLNGDRTTDASDLSIVDANCAAGTCVSGCLDGDCDGYGLPGNSACPVGSAGDCNDSDVEVWSPPDEVHSLTASRPSGTSDILIDWSPLPSGGGTLGSMAYDALRSTTAESFEVGATCVESDDSSDTSAIDTQIPAVGSVFHYLIRGDNNCPGAGSLGQQSGGQERSGRTCP